jgi:hypothetical protein
MALMENGLINLAAIVGLLVFCMGLIPIILIKGTTSPPSNHPSPQDPDRSE